jgi:Zn finger protein HypA/HybF involved in hydrogenase expression
MKDKTIDILIPNGADPIKVALLHTKCPDCKVNLSYNKWICPKCKKRLKFINGTVE